MSFTHYMVLTTYGTATQNKLQVELRNELLAMDRMLITAEGLPLLKQQICNKIKRINSKYANCKPVPAKFYDSEHEKENGSFLLSTGGFTFLYLRIVGAKLQEANF